MKFRIFFLLLALCLFSATDGLQAQKKQADRAADRAENRANRKVDNKVNNTVDSAVDDAFNAIGGLFKKKDKKKKAKQNNSGAEEPAAANEDGMNAEEQQAQENGMAGMGSLFGGKWEPYTNPREFSANWNMTTTKRNGKQEEMVMQFSILKEHCGVKITSPDEAEATRMLLNTQDGKTTMITTDKKGETSGYRLRMPNMQAMVEKEMEKQQAEMAERFTINATGERMNIDGYDCEKIVVTDTKTGDVTTSWITQDINLTSVEMSQGMAGAFAGGAQMKMPEVANSQLMEGVFIKSKTVSGNGKETTEVHVTDIKVDGATDKSIFNTDGIEITDAGF